ncbi:MAG: SUMF1/EgtB/PvdO family nonheme iron enzyme [Bernardetiaceae bacterium]|nr:SUMF1/EgtB/PvdO family nonheme iron enzyme [Bernardetiaceae bacterium]
MTGNVFEWCEDDGHSSYEGAPSDGSAWIDTPRSSRRIHRGGFWISRSSNCYIACRSMSDTDSHFSIGFRLVASVIV